MGAAVTISKGGARHAARPTHDTRQLLADNRSLISANSDLECAVYKALMKSLQDAMLIAQLQAERDLAVAEVRRLQDKVIRAGAEHARLRQAVIHARPRITPVPCDLVRPYSPDVVLPYVSPVPYRDNSNDDTQNIALADLPQTATAIGIQARLEVA
jgi:hypothetical protein